MNKNELNKLMSDKNLSADGIFIIISQIALLIQQSEKEARNLLLKLLEQREKIPADFNPIIATLLSRLGLFPYVEKIEKNFIETLNYEFHRSENLKEIVFHSEQFKASLHLKREKSLILSASTSFGKSLLIQEIIASKKYKNIVIIEPTLALIDEMRDKLKHFENDYKIIFSKSQQLDERNIFLFTQERVIEYENLPSIDFFVIDEFYKLSFEQDERGSILNHAFYYLLKHTRNYYLLGPKIDGIPFEFEEKNNAVFYYTDYETVNVERTYLPKKSHSELEKLLSQLSDPTLVYLSGPGTVETSAKKFSKSFNESNYASNHAEIISWIKSNVHEEWGLISLLEKGIAFHHGELPRHISKYIVRSFNEGHIKYLFCTSTLIEGVNTSAKNVVVYDNKKGRSNLLTKFDMNNIAGRAGRMGRYFNGNVYIFGEEPKESATYVDIPWFTQDYADDELLVQLEQEDLKPDSIQKVDKYKNDSNLSFETIKTNSNISPNGQIMLAQYLSKNLTSTYSLLNWTDYPKAEQFKYVCELIWDYLIIPRGKSRAVDGVVSGKQLAFFVSDFQNNNSFQKLVAIHLKRNSNAKVDETIRLLTRIQKKWLEFRLPKLLMALHYVQKEVFEKNNLKPGNYKFYTKIIEGNSLPEVYASLKELGLPYELIKKISEKYGEEEVDVDQIILKIKKDIDHLKLPQYELNILKKI